MTLCCEFCGRHHRPHQILPGTPALVDITKPSADTWRRTVTAAVRADLR